MDPQVILNYASEFFDVSKEEITARNKKDYTVIIRQYICKCAEAFGSTHEQIAVVLNVDRSTVTMAIRRADYQCKNNRDYNDTYIEFREFVFPTKFEKKKMICFPGLDEYENMTIDTLTKWKITSEDLSDYIKRKILKQIQK